jgi:hypothetical protein
VDGGQADRNTRLHVERARPIQPIAVPAAWHSFECTDRPYGVEVAEQQYRTAVTTGPRTKMVSAKTLAEEFDVRAGTAQKTGKRRAAAVDGRFVGGRRFESDQCLDRLDRVAGVLPAILEEIRHASRL